MPNACGYAVFETSTTTQRVSDLYAALRSFINCAGYKGSDLHPAYTRFIQLLTHSVFTQITTVRFHVVHTIHSTNKKYKKFYLNILLLIYRKAVHI